MHNPYPHPLKNLAFEERDQFPPFFVSMLGMGWVKTRPEIWPNPRPFWPTRPDPNYNFENSSNPRYNFVQPDCDLTCTAPPFCQMHCSTIPELGQIWQKNEKKTWPEFDPNQISLTRAQKSLTRDPTRARSPNPKPDPRPEKWTRPIPITRSNWLRFRWDIS